MIITSTLIDAAEQHPDRACATALAWLRAAPRTVAELLAEHHDWAVWAIQRGLCPPDLLTEIAGDGDWAVRCAVAGHPACPPATHADSRGTSTGPSAARWRGILRASPTC